MKSKAKSAPMLRQTKGKMGRWWSWMPFGVKLLCLLIVISSQAPVTARHISASAQNESVTLSVEQLPLKDVLRRIEKQTNFLFIYSKDIDAARPVSLKVNNESLPAVLEKLLSPLQLGYRTEGKHITIVKKPATVKKSISTAQIREIR